MGALDLSGKWLKDQENSDLNAYGEMLSLLGLSGIRKTGALKLINTLALEHSTEEPHFIVRYVASRVQFLKSVEEFTLGHSVEMPRRDGEKGVQIGAMTQDDTQVQTVITWGEPNPGAAATDLYVVLLSRLLIQYEQQHKATSTQQDYCLAVRLTETYSQPTSGVLVTEALLQAQGKQLHCKQVHGN